MPLLQNLALKSETRNQKSEKSSKAEKKLKLEKAFFPFFRFQFFFI